MLYTHTLTVRRAFLYFRYIGHRQPYARMRVADANANIAGIAVAAAATLLRILVFMTKSYRQKM